jgi:hypothetical protein
MFLSDTQIAALIPHAIFGKAPAIAKDRRKQLAPNSILPRGTSMGRFESLFLISPSQTQLPREIELTRRGFDVLGSRGEPVPNDTQGGD